MSSRRTGRWLPRHERAWLARAPPLRNARPHLLRVRDRVRVGVRVRVSVRVRVRDRVGVRV